VHSKLTDREEKLILKKKHEFEGDAYLQGIIASSKMISGKQRI